MTIRPVRSTQGRPERLEGRRAQGHPAPRPGSGRPEAHSKGEPRRGVADCVFCRIAGREIPADVLYEDDEVLAFRDIHPKYRTHLLLIPKRHIASATGMQPTDDAVVGRLIRIGAALAQKEGIAGSGFRLATNTGADAGQVVQHLHVHLLGGEPLRPI